MASGQQSYQRPHVLIVTDDDDLRDFLSEGLVVAGFWTSTVASALQALEVFRLRTFDLAIVDLALGGMSAIELIRRLRGHASDASSSDARTDIPLIALSGDVADPASTEALKAGADERLAPPLELEELALHLYEVVQRWREDHPGRPYADEVAQATGRIQD